MFMQITLLVLLVLASATARAQDAGRDQKLFRDLTRDLGAALSYSGQAPTERPGFSAAGIRSPVTPTTVEDRIERRRVGSGTHSFVIPLLQVSSDAARYVDVGGYAAASPDGDARLYGVSARYALAKRQAGQPPLAAIRASYAGLEGYDVVNISSQSLELTFTRPGDGFTPYWGLGQVWVAASPDSAEGSGPEQLSLEKRYLGISIEQQAGHQFALELDRTGDLTTLGARFSLEF